MKYEIPDEQTVENILSLNYTRSMAEVMGSPSFSAFSELGMEEEYMASVRRAIIENQEALIELLELAPRDRLMGVCAAHFKLESFRPYIREIVTLLVKGRDTQAWERFQSMKEVFGENLPSLMDYKSLVWLDVRV